MSNSGRWIPRLSYTNYRKEYGSSLGTGAFKRWFWVSRFWKNLLINVGVRHRVVTFDFRRDLVKDLLHELPGGK